jgi:hypothetical protein
MRKLNRIYAVLSDPERRRDYDEALDEDYAPAVIQRPVIVPGITRFAGRMAWALAILCSAGLLTWLTTQSTPGSQGSVHEENPAPAVSSVSAPAPTILTPDQTSLIANLRSNLKVVTMERNAAIREIGRLRGMVAAEEPATPARPDAADIRIPAIAATDLPSAVKLPILANFPPAVRTEIPASHRFAGFWFYAKSLQGQHNRNLALYPPEFIEATISEDNGSIHGKYRSRFEIVDRAISPNVNFTFTGARSATPQLTIPWTGAGGAKGELTLKLLSDTSLRIDWKASDLGTQQGLDSGTAVLTRRVE